MPKKLVVVVLVVLLYSRLFVLPTLGAVSSCSVTLDTHSVDAGVTTTVYFSLTNTSSSDITWIKVISPSSSFVVLSGAASGWNSEVTSADVTFTGSVMYTGGRSKTIEIDMSASDYNSSGNWIVQTSDVVSGDNPTNCSGDLLMNITGGVEDSSGPVISDIVISDLTYLSAKISWTTDELATSGIDYGETMFYGVNVADSGYDTSHSFTLTGLSPSTTYHFALINEDSSSNQSYSSDYTFTTLLYNSNLPSPTPKVIYETRTEYVTETKIETETVTETVVREVEVTPTPYIDRFVPVIDVESDFSKPFERSPSIYGLATDDSVIKQVEYSIDGGNNWQLVDNVESGRFEFTPSPLEDGDYAVLVKGVDGSGNVGMSDSFTMVIDRLPPQVGSILSNIGAQVLVPSRDGVLIAMAGIDQGLTLSSVGGARLINVFSELGMSNSKELNGRTGNKNVLGAGMRVFSLVKNKENGLWNGVLNFTEPGVYQLSTKAIDGAGNLTESMLPNVVVINNGRIMEEGGLPIKGAKVSLYKKKKDYSWDLWDGDVFGQQNPQVTDDNGGYRLFIPSGEYYLRIDADGYRSIVSDIFILDKTMPINTDFIMEKGIVLDIGNFEIPLGNFIPKSVSVVIRIPDVFVQGGGGQPVAKKMADSFVLPRTDGEMFRFYNSGGKTRIFSFVNTWSSASLEQIEIINNIYKEQDYGFGGSQSDLDIDVILSEEKYSKATVFQKRGGYVIPFVVDQDGVLFKKYNLFTLPTHYFIDEYGVVKQIVNGVLTEKEIGEILDSI